MTMVRTSLVLWAEPLKSRGTSKLGTYISGIRVLKCSQNRFTPFRSKPYSPLRNVSADDEEVEEEEGRGEDLHKEQALLALLLPTLLLLLSLLKCLQVLVFSSCCYHIIVFVFLFSPMLWIPVRAGS